MDANTLVCAVIGNPVRHSLSPAIHNAAFKECGLNYVYVAFEVTDVRAALEGVKGLGIRGLSVTIPHKVEVMEYLDEIDPLAERMGSVNTIVNREGRLYGMSSDGYGTLKALEEQGVRTAGQWVVMFGAGGAARAVGFTLAQQGRIGRLRIVELREKAELLDHTAREIESAADCLVETTLAEDRDALGAQIRECDILVNCTPVGMHPKTDASIIPADWHRKDLAVFDAVYNPRKTLLLRHAEAAGATCVEGLGMFVHQAAVQFELWTGVEAPVETMRKVVIEALEK